MLNVFRTEEDTIKELKKIIATANVDFDEKEKTLSVYEPATAYRVKALAGDGVQSEFIPVTEDHDRPEWVFYLSEVL